MLSTRNLKAGDVLDGRYRLDRRVGGGGMGDVWEATDTILWRSVAVKILLADLVDDRGFRERFLREARAIAVMKGPGVVEVYDYGEIDHGDAAIVYLIMEFVDGKPLSRLLGLWGKLGVADSLRVVGGVAEALHVAHTAGIVHRDIKPGNILVRDDGSVVLVDFGIARANHNLTLTTTGVVLGTVTYMSPEQAAGENLTAASDLYSLGIVAHQCLAGSPPFRADTPLGVLSAHLRKPPPRLPAEVPGEVADIVARALQKEPADRWPDAATFAEACRRTRASMAPPAPRTVPEAPTAIESAGGHHRAENGRAAGAGPPRHGTGTQVTGARGVVAPPSGDDPAAVEHAPRRLRMWAVLAGALAATVALGAIVALSPWNDPLNPGTVPSGETGHGDAGVVDQDGDIAGTNSGGEDRVDGEDAGEPTAGEESSAPEGEDDASSSPSGEESSTRPSDEPSTTPSESPTEVETVAVPNVVDRSEWAARNRLEESGLAPAVEYEGEGEHKCSVVRQHPGAGTTVETESSVQITVERADDAAGCNEEADQTPTPRPAD